MPLHPVRRWTRRLVFLGLLLLHPHAASSESPDAFPIRRVPVAAEQVPQEMQRVRDGVLLKMRLDQFEEQRVKAARASGSPTAPCK